MKAEGGERDEEGDGAEFHDVWREFCLFDFSI